MLHDRRQRHRERLREHANREFVVLREARQQRAPRRVGERRERAVEGGVFILNHTV